jgi:predicted Fe-Mo cluster-binding NifX family protein
MKTIITSTENQIEAPLDLRFGRCSWFCLYDHDTAQAEFIKNEFSDARGGAGTKVAELMLNLGADRIISGDFGPKAKELLDKFKIQLIKMDDDHKTIREIITSFK